MLRVSPEVGFFLMEFPGRYRRITQLLGAPYHDHLSGRPMFTASDESSLTPMVEYVGRVGLFIYSESVKVRRTINHQPQTEPASADEVLPYPAATVDQIG